MMNFTNWYQNICKKLTKSGHIKGIEKDFTTQSTDYGRIKVLSQNEILLKEEIEESYRGKNNTQSESYRTVGNKFYRSSVFEHAIKSYTRAIRHAENNTSTLSLAYANRSAVLFAIGEYSFCKDDILLALENKYPKELLYKLYERLGNCYLKAQIRHEAQVYFKNSLESLNWSNLNTEKRHEKENHLHSLLEKCDNIKESSGHYLADVNQMYEVHVPELVGNKNDTYLCASDSLTVKHDKTRGRYAIANKDIQAGEIIIIEKPFASVCLPGFFETHCYHCLKRFKFAYPCRNCSRISYCSIACEKDSWVGFHQYECRYFDLLVQSDVGLGHLAMKVVLQNDIDALRGFEKDYKEIENVFGLDGNGVFDSQNYFCLYSLVGNGELRAHSDLFRRSLMSLYLSKILQKSGYIEENDSTLKAIIASHLLKQIQMLPCNAHEISEAQLSSSDLIRNELKEIGSAAYTTLSLLNHSCDPSVVRHCYGDVCVVRALKHIAAGKEIIDNYGFLYAVEERDGRVKHLQEQYYFTCQCIPCTENWPLYNDLASQPPLFKCQYCIGHINEKTLRCNKCAKQDSEVVAFCKDQIQNEFEMTMQNVLNGDGLSVTKDLKFLLSYLDLLTRKAVLPNIHVNNCQEIVKLCFSLSANFAKI